MKIMIGKIGETLNVDLTRMPRESIEFVTEYGLKQLLNDCHASITPKMYPDKGELTRAVIEAVNNKVEALYNGSIRSGGGGGRTIDPVTALARKFAELDIKSAMARKGIKLSEYRPAMAATLVEANMGTTEPGKVDYFAKAAKEVKLNSAGIDLSALGL